MRSEEDEKVLVSYLLGNLSEAEQVQVEDRAFADAEYLTALEGAEADLIDAWVRGELPSSDRRAFEQRFLTSATRRRKVEFARALANVTAGSTEFEPESRTSFMVLLREWSMGVRLAAGVAALIIIAGPVWLAVQNSAMRSRLASLEDQRQQLELANHDLRRQVAGQGHEGAIPPEQRHVTAMPVIASLVLLPGLSRAETRREQLVLTPDAQLARIEIQLEPRDDYPRFRAEIRTLGGEDVLNQSNLRSRSVAGGHAIWFEVPSSLLRAGDYELSLKGISPERGAVDVGYYYFGVRKQ